MIKIFKDRFNIVLPKSKCLSGEAACKPVIAVRKSVSFSCCYDALFRWTEISRN